MPFKFLLAAAFTLVALLYIGAHFSSGAPLVFVYVWLFLLSMWALLHVKKSTTTWNKFEEIDQREADFAEEVDKRLDTLHREVKSLKDAKKAAAAAIRQEKKPVAKKRKKTKKVQRTHVEEQKQDTPKPTSEENKE